MIDTQQRDEMEFDSIIVGGGPAGLIAAYRLLKRASLENKEISVCVLEKGSEIGAHLLSGALFDTGVLNELFTEQELEDAPLGIPSENESVCLLTKNMAFNIPNILVPQSLHNKKMRILSLGRLCQWIAEKVEALGGEIFPAFTAMSLVWEKDKIIGVLTGDMGLDKQGNQTSLYEPGMRLLAKQTLLCEGSRGHLGKQVIKHFQLDKHADFQQYAIGFKEKWKVAESMHKPGLVLHGTGWPLTKGMGGGFYLYHAENNEIWLGLIVDLNYKNPHFNPYQAFQEFKQHPHIYPLLNNSERLAYGARTITKGGFDALPKMIFPGGFILGCDAGTLDSSRMKGIHTAMYSALYAADTIADLSGEGINKESTFNSYWENSQVYTELKQTRSFAPALHRLGGILGGAYNRLNELVRYGLPVLKESHDNRSTMIPVSEAKPYKHSKIDKKKYSTISDSIFLANIEHDEDQPCHLKVEDTNSWLVDSYKRYLEPAQRYCPAGVYGVIENHGVKKLQINEANCLHCKTCDIKDPTGKITWTAPQGGSGPNYQGM